MPRSAACLRTVVRLAQQRQVADVAAQQHVRGAQHPLLGALRQHHPAAVGAGRSSSSCSNIIGVTRPERATASRSVSSAVSTWRSKRPSAVSALRGVAARQLALQREQLGRGGK